MAGDWKELTLDQLGRIVTGKTPSSKGEGYFGGTIPFVTPTDFNGRRIITDTGRYLTVRGAASVAGARIPSRAVMVTCIGSDMGKAAIAGRECVTNQQINSILVGDGNEPLFVYYNLSGRKAEIRSHASGSAQPILNKSGFGALEIALPPLREQQAIACILGALDDKIELNRRMNRTLEEMARAIFKSWFVDFDPVRAKASGQQPQGLKPEIVAPFPDSFEESELGEIPKGWRVGRLGDLVENVIKRVQPSAYTESIPYVPIECIDSRTVCLSNSQPGEKARSSLTCFQEGDILFGAMRPYFHKVCIAPFEGTTRTTAFILRPKATELAYVALVISRDETIDYATAHSEGSTIPYAKWAESLQDMRIIIPPQGLRCSFHRYVRPFIQRMMVSVSDNKTLAELRDTLLPKLISGELRLPDAERIAGRLL